MNRAFEVHLLNEDGKAKARLIAEAFDRCFSEIAPLVVDGRCKALVLTKLEEAAFFAKKGMALAVDNQLEPPAGPEVLSP